MPHNRILFGLVLGATAGVAANAIWGGADPRGEGIVFNSPNPLVNCFCGFF